MTDTLNTGSCYKLVLAIVLQAFQDLRDNYRAARKSAMLGNRLWVIEDYCSYEEARLEKGKRPKALAEWYEETRSKIKGTINRTSDAEGWLQNAQCREWLDLSGLSGPAYSRERIAAAIGAIKLDPELEWGASARDD